MHRMKCLTCGTERTNDEVNNWGERRPFLIFSDGGGQSYWPCPTCSHYGLTPIPVKEPAMTFPNLTRTAAALAAFDAAHGPRDPGYGSPLAEAVGVAYGLDTADRNDPETCAACVRPGPRKPLGGDADLSFVRRMVRTFLEQVALSEEIVAEVLAEETD